MNRFHTATTPLLLAAMLALTACGDDAKSPTDPAVKPSGTVAKAEAKHADGDEHGDEAED